ncbi:MAG: HRDC domain-containing protein [Gemmatimonadota bacterium]
MTYRLIADDSALLDVSTLLRSQSRIALDCEAAGFHRYTDRLCLVQLSTPDETLLFDPLAADPADILRVVLEDPEIQVVMHGADFDLRLLHRDLGIRVRGLFDTQAAATLLGATSIGLAALLEEHMGIKLSKEHQRADWAQRPLPDGLLEYAAGDTRHLLALAEALTREIEDKGRGAWAEDEFRFLEEIQWEEDQTDPVTRFKGARHLRPRHVTLLRAVLAWRDGVARDWDRAPFRVVGDPTLAAIVMERPDSIDALANLKGMSPRLARMHGEELLEKLGQVDGLPDSALLPFPPANRNGLGRFTPEEEAMADAVRDLRSARAQDLGLEKGVLLSNAQINEIIRSGPRSIEALHAVPGLRGWQAGILGLEILQILGK